MGDVVLTLYVSGRSPSARAAIDSIRRVCEHHLPDATWEVVDIAKDPGRAEADKILATPTLIRWRPEPILRIVGRLDHPEEVLIGLDEPVPDEMREASS